MGGAARGLPPPRKSRAQNPVSGLGSELLRTGDQMEGDVSLVPQAGGEEGNRPRAARGRPRAALLGLTAALLVLGEAEAWSQVAPVGVARNAIGVLLVTRSDGRRERLQGKGALPLFLGDELRTTAGAQALVEFSDGTRVALNEWTTFVVLSRQRPDTGITRVLSLLVGEIWVNTAGGPRPLEVETPAATATIRGTELTLRVSPEGRSVLTVVEGVVEFGNALGTWPIRAGSMSSSEPGARCTPPAPADVRSATAWISEVVK